MRNTNLLFHLSMQSLMLVGALTGDRTPTWACRDDALTSWAAPARAELESEIPVQDGLARSPTRLPPFTFRINTFKTTLNKIPSSVPQSQRPPCGWRLPCWTR